MSETLCIICSLEFRFLHITKGDNTNLHLLIQTSKLKQQSVSEIPKQLEMHDLTLT